LSGRAVRTPLSGALTPEMLRHRRLILAAACLPAFALAGVAAHPHTRVVATPATTRGTYSLIHADGGRFDDTYTPAVMTDGKLITVKSLSVAPGSKVTLRADSLISATLAPHTATGTRRLLIVPVVWGTKTIKGTQKADKTFGTGPLTTWYKTASYGLFAWSANATPKVKISAPTGTDILTWLDEIAARANTKVAALGYNPSNYSEIMYETPTLIGGAAGYGMVPGRYAWVKTPLNIRVAAHELGHTLGLYHAHADECGSAQTLTGIAFAAPTCSTVNHACGSATGSASASCWSEYGDPFAAMGESWMQMTNANPNAGSFDAAEKAQLGWVSAANTRSQVATANGAYDLSPYEPSAHTAPQALNIPVANGDFWFEYRNWTGIDSVFQKYFTYYAQPLPSGVLVHVDHPTNGGGDYGSLLLDTTAAASPFSNACQKIGFASLPGFCDAELQTGRSFIDPGQFVVNTAHLGSGNEQLQVTFDTTAPDVSGMLFAPAAGATGVAAQPTFQWTAASDAESGIEYYMVWIDLTPIIVPAGATLQYTPSTPFASGSTHHWTVTAWNRVDMYTRGPIQTFTVG
jgi:hypothetical protein